MAERKRVNVFMRIEGHREVHIGSARTISDVPELLSMLVELLRSGMRPDALEPDSAPTGRRPG